MDFLSGEIAKLKKDAQVKNGKVQKRARSEEKDEQEKDAKEEPAKVPKRVEQQQQQQQQQPRNRRGAAAAQERVPLSNDEITAQLRKLGQPIIYFAETEPDRYKRMLRLQRKEQKRQEEEKEATQDYTIDPQDVASDQDKVNLQMRAYIKHLLKQFHDKPLVAETRENLEPLMNLLRTKTLDDQMFPSLASVLVALQKRDFQQANKAYYQLSIGNAAWPVGVMAVGIHARKNLAKITGMDGNTANIIKSATTRLWITAVKRLISWSES